MIKFGKELELMIKHEQITTIRIKNFGKRVADVHASTPEELITELNTLAPSIASYGKLIFLAGKDADIKSNYTNALEWLVTFPSDGNYTQINNSPSGGTFNKNMYDLMLENAMLKNSKIFEDRIKALEEGNNKEDQYMQYLPFVAPMLGMKDDDMLKRLQMSMMIKNPAMLKGMLSGAPGASNVSTEEADKLIGEKLESISKKVPSDKMLKLVTVLESNPALADTLISLIPAQPGMAGADPSRTQVSGEAHKEFKPTKNNPAPGLYLAGSEDDMF